MVLILKKKSKKAKKSWGSNVLTQHSCVESKALAVVLAADTRTLKSRSSKLWLYELCQCKVVWWNKE